jgi:SH3 domain protein
MSDMNLRVRGIFYIAICLVISSVCAQAKTMYVTDSKKIPVRAGKGTAYKILTFVESNQKVELLQKDNQWSLVRLEDGKEGWVNSRYLINNPTSKIKFEELSLEHQNLIDQTESLKADFKQLKLDNTKLKSTLASTKKSLNNQLTDYEALKADSSDFLALKSKYEIVSKQLSEKTQKVENLAKQISDSQLYYYLKWILAVSGILLIGFIIGYIVKRPRRQPSLL